MSRRVLVTGAAGFAGRHLCAALAARGCEVIGAGLDEGGDPVPAATAVQTLDICDAPAVARLVGEVAPAAIIHLAAWSSAGRSFAEPRRALEVNALGTLNLLEALRAQVPRCRFLLVSSADVYGPCAAGARHDEAAPFAPRSPYAASKAAGELLTMQYAASYNLDAIRIRPFSHTGPGQRPTFVLPGFARQIASIEAGLVEPALRVGRLDVERDYTDVRDVVTCYCDILSRADRGAVYNVCSGRGYHLEALLEQLVALARVPLRIEQDAARLRPSDLPRLVGDPGRVTRELGWAPAITMERTLSDLIEEARAASSRAAISD